MKIDYFLLIIPYSSLITCINNMSGKILCTPKDHHTNRILLFMMKTMKGMCC